MCIEIIRRVAISTAIICYFSRSITIICNIAVMIAISKQNAIRTWYSLIAINCKHQFIAHYHWLVSMFVPHDKCLKPPRRGVDFVRIHKTS